MLANGFRFGEGLKFFEKRIPVRAGSLAGPEDDRANRLQWLDGQMADGREYLCGKRFTMADILLYGWLDFAGTVGQPLDTGQCQYRGVVGARGANGRRRRHNRVTGRRSLFAGDGFHHSANFDHPAGCIVRYSWSSRAAHAEIEHRGFSAVLNGDLA